MDTSAVKIPVNDRYSNKIKETGLTAKKDCWKNLKYSAGLAGLVPLRHKIKLGVCLCVEDGCEVELRVKVVAFPDNSSTIK